MKISSSGYSSSMQIASSMMLFTLCTCLLLNVRPGSSVALNIPPSVQSNDSEINTNSIIPESGTKLANSTSKNNELQTPTDSPPLANCTKNSTEKIYNESAMIDSVRRHFLAKLNLTEAPSRLQAGIKLEIPPALMLSYYASLQTMQQSADDQNCPDKKTTHYSRSVKLYSPDYYVSAQAIPDQFVHADSDDGKSSTAITTSSDTDKESFPPVLYSLRFDHLDLARVSRLWSVTLKLYKRKVTHKSSGVRRGTNPSDTVKVFQVQRKSSTGKLNKVYQLFTTKNVRSEHEGYVSFDITEGIKRWREGSSQQQTLELDVLIDTPEIVRSGLNLPPIIMFDVPTYGKGERRKAQLVVETLSDKENLTAVLNNTMHHRRKRTTAGVNSRYCFENPSETNCCIREATINFDRDLHWDWIILPETFNPNYCSGGCQNPRWPYATKSTSYLTQLRESNPTAAAEPCCVPHELKSITVLMVINGQIILNDIPDMVVKSCICR